MYTLKATDHLNERLDKHHQNNLWRKRLCFSKRDGNKIELSNNVIGKMINFSSNDYLSLATDQRIKQAVKEAVDCYGFGSSASSLACGYSDAQRQLEDAFALFLNRQKALFFNSGYMANLGVLTSLANRHSNIASDKLNHASLLDGIQLSRAKQHRYQHNNIEHLEKILNQNQIDLIVTESVFSMEGDLAKLNKITEKAQKYQAITLVDDAHGIGVLGKNGLGVCEHFNLNEADVPVLISPLGKAFAGVGAIVSGSSNMIDAIMQFSKSYIYTTALPPLAASGLLASLKIIQKEHWRREKLNDLILFLIEKAKSLGFKLISEDLTPIKSILISDNELVITLQKVLLAKGFLVSAIRPPTVPEGTARIRISLNAFHTKDEISQLLETLAQAYQKNKDKVCL